MKKVELVVTGMVCEGCQNRVVNALSLIEGVTNINASFKENKVSFDMNDNVLLEDVKESILDLGFEVE